MYVLIIFPQVSVFCSYFTCTADVYVEEPVKLYDSTNPDWVPHLRMGYEVEAPDKERYERLEQRKKESCSV